MKNFFSSATIALLALLASTPVFAGDFLDLRTEMASAREAMSTMLLNKDKRGADQQARVKETADRVSEHLRKMKAPADKQAQFNELLQVWAAFKKTRETELVPATLAGKETQATNIFNGIQKVRYNRMRVLMDELAAGETL